MKNNNELKKFYKASKMKIWFLENVVNKVKLKKIKSKKYLNSIHYINKNTDKTYMEYYQKNGHLWVSYSKIWSYFEDNYSDNDMEIQELIKLLMAEHYGLIITKPFSLCILHPGLMLESCNLKVVTSHHVINLKYN